MRVLSGFSQEHKGKGKSQIKWSQLFTCLESVADISFSLQSLQLSHSSNRVSQQLELVAYESSHKESFDCMYLLNWISTVYVVSPFDKGLHAD